MTTLSSSPLSSPYARLARLHALSGAWLLLWPCWWGLALASHGKPPLAMLALFAAGAVVMRAAGCVINDMADRRFDREVERTRTRPLASGELTLPQAAIFLMLLLLLGLSLAWLLGAKVLGWAVLALPLVATYPFMKRITWWPQLFLGFTFNWGALLGFVAIFGHPTPAAFALYAAGIAWTLGYDTLYAHQDKADDARIGVKSTALRLGDASKRWVGGFYALTVAGLALAGYLQNMGVLYYAFLLLAAAHFACQIRQVNLDDPASCKAAFASNTWLGWLPFAGMLLGG